MCWSRASRVLTAIFLLALTNWSGGAQAATAEVRDEAHFFSADAVAKANESINEIKLRYKKDLRIETRRRVPEDKSDEANSSEQKVKGHFFANWAIERARTAGVNGIYVLITREPGHVEVVVGNQTRTVFPDEQRYHLSQLLLTHFRQKQYDEGLLAAVKDVRSALADSPTAGKVVATPANHNRPAHNPSTLPGGRVGASDGSWLRWLGIGLAVVLGIWILSAVMKALSGNQPRPIGAGYGGPTPVGSSGPYGYGGYGGYGTGSGGFFSGLMGGLFGAAAGSWLYDQFSGDHSHLSGQGPMGGWLPSSTTRDRQDTDYTAEGGDFDQSAEGYADDSSNSVDNNSSEGGGGDFGGGGDAFGGGDFGGGGDTGGGDSGSGGDF